MSVVDQQITEAATEPIINNDNPQKTFFKEIFTTYANFGVNSRSVGISSGNLTFGTEKTFRIPSGGDLLTKMYLDVTLPAVHGTVVTGSTYANWVNNVGHALISNIELQISNNKIDSHSNVYLDILNELTDDNEKEYKLIGKYKNITDLKIKQTKSTKYSIPLKFFFNKNNGVGLPLFVLGEDTVKIKVNINSLVNLVLFDGSGSISNVNMSSLKLRYDTISLSNTEKDAIRRNLPYEILIETVQSFENLTNFNNITIENPVKELIFVLRKNDRKTSTNPRISLNKSVTRGNDIFNYNGTTKTNSENYDIFNTAHIKWGNYDITDGNESAIFFREEQVQKYHSRNPDKNIYVYSFDIEPENYKPAGYINFSRDTSKALSFNFTGLESNVTLNVYALTFEYLYVQNDRGDLRDVPIEGAY